MTKVKSIMNNLKYPPLKPQKIPNRLIWYGFDKVNNKHEFHMFATNTNYPMTALMRCCKSKYEDPPTMFITLLAATYMNKGLGSEMLKFAENFSREQGCEGRLKLKSTCVCTPNRIPHLFYRKFGFAVEDPKINQKLDKFIKNNKYATYKDFNDMIMFYDPNKNIEKNFSIWEKIRKIFS